MPMLPTLTGEWKATNHLWFMPGTPAHDSASTLTVAPVVGDAVTMLRYTWSHDGALHEGVMLLRDVSTAPPQIVWYDSFHTGGTFMVFGSGTRTDTLLAATGSYAAPEGPDWGWRIEVHTLEPGVLLLRHYNILPDGQEAIAVEARYTPATAS
jgi:hypothetical protein